jgi:hypothetical protein
MMRAARVGRPDVNPSSGEGLHPNGGRDEIGKAARQNIFGPSVSLPAPSLRPGGEEERKV